MRPPLASPKRDGFKRDDFFPPQFSKKMGGLYLTRVRFGGGVIFFVWFVVEVFIK
jgi:hypothetical protein